MKMKYGEELKGFLIPFLVKGLEIHLFSSIVNNGGSIGA